MGQEGKSFTEQPRYIKLNAPRQCRHRRETTSACPRAHASLAGLRACAALSCPQGHKTAACQTSPRGALRSSAMAR